MPWLASGICPCLDTASLFGWVQCSRTSYKVARDSYAKRLLWRVPLNSYNVLVSLSNVHLHMVRVSCAQRDMHQLPPLPLLRELRLMASEQPFAAGDIPSTVEDLHVTIQTKVAFDSLWEVLPSSLERLRLTLWYDAFGPYNGYAAIITHDMLPAQLRSISVQGVVLKLQSLPKSLTELRAGASFLPQLPHTLPTELLYLQYKTKPLIPLPPKLQTCELSMATFTLGEFGLFEPCKHTLRTLFLDNLFAADEYKASLPQLTSLSLRMFTDDTIVPQQVFPLLQEMHIKLLDAHDQRIDSRISDVIAYIRIQLVTVPYLRTDWLPQKLTRLEVLQHGDPSFIALRNYDVIGTFSSFMCLSVLRLMAADATFTDSDIPSCLQVLDVPQSIVQFASVAQLSLVEIRAATVNALVREKWVSIANDTFRIHGPMPC